MLLAIIVYAGSCHRLAFPNRCVLFEDYANYSISGMYINDYPPTALGRFLPIANLSHDPLLLGENRPLRTHISLASITNNLARHQVVLQAIRCIAYCTAGILWDRFRFANHCVLRHFASLLTTFYYNRLNPSFCRTLHKIVVLHSESTDIPLKRLRGLIANMRVRNGYQYN